MEPLGYFEHTHTTGVGLRRVSGEELAAVRRKAKKLIIYAGSILTPLVINDADLEFGALVFCPQGCLLDAYGNERIMAWMREAGIEPGMRWMDEGYGANVVSVGLKDDAPVRMEGAEHTCPIFKSGRFAYSPIKLENGSLLGGLVVASPRRSGVEDVRYLAVTVARNIELQFFWFGALGLIGSFAEGMGFLALDQSNKENRILLFTEEAVKIFGLEKRDYFYDKLEKVIPDSEENRVFWDIVNAHKSVHDQAVSMAVGGKRAVINISAAPYDEKKFHMHGMSFQINSLRRIGKLIAKYSDSTVRYGFEDIIGTSPVFAAAIQRARMFSYTDSNILLQGESGVGKDIFAQAIHNGSSRNGKPFIAVNCAAFSKDLIASELFGYESGAFTGARKEGAIGKFELANRGTLFLDEIGDMPLDLQAVLLRVIEEQSFRRVGGNELIHIDVRIIAASNRALDHQIGQRLFREDLYYRLGTLRLTIPPLRERGDDILLLAERFAGQICGRMDKPPVAFAPSTASFMRKYPWNGNVRELRNVLEGILSINDGCVVTEAMLFDFLYEGTGGALPAESAAAPPPAPAGDPFSERYYDQAEIERALARYRGNKSRAAKSLGISRGTLYRWMRNFGMESVNNDVF
ncbi:MAG: sigma 54-interacting transcriptional regulator [Clostridiales Family XIII bacterium]|jgi:transcriptional regulator with PAS, ATPase and Fis domain|nr:sigma 54-interacting transcriptional regulator [Clostridiales Family XIII bacterium]